MAVLSEAPGVPAGRDARPRVVAVGGPTGTGKTALAVALAKRFDGEIISADSMQLYRGLTIGTAKATPAERQGIPHHLLDVLDPEQAFSAADYTAAAARCIDKITARGRLPIVAGGTGLYITSLLEGVIFTPQKPDPALRAALQAQAAAEGPAALYERLRQADPAAAAVLHPTDVTRVIRALELWQTTGQTMAGRHAASRPAAPPYRSLCLCLACRDRAVLYRRVDARVDGMLAAGLLEEVRRVYDHRTVYKTAAQAIGYKEFFPYFAGTATKEACVAALKQATRRYAKRQLTWFRHKNDAEWLYIDDPGDLTARAAARVEAFLKSGDPEPAASKEK